MSAAVEPGEKFSPQPFHCPECGGREAGKRLLVCPAESSNDPWTGVLEIIPYIRCRRHLPAHLAERWSGLSLPAARAEWRHVFRRRLPYPPA